MNTFLYQIGWGVDLSLSNWKRTDCSDCSLTCEPFRTSCEARQYWLHFTEYVRAPAVQHFASLPDLLLQAYGKNAEHLRLRSNLFLSESFGQGQVEDT